MDGMVHVQVTIRGAADLDAEHLESAARSLRRELAEGDVEDVTFASTPPPPGAKGEGFSWGTLILSLASGQGFAAVVGKLLDWGTRRPDLTLTMEIGGDKLQVGGLSATEQHQLIKAWLDRHPKASPAHP